MDSVYKALEKKYPYLFVTALTNNPFDLRLQNEIEKETIGDLRCS